MSTITLIRPPSLVGRFALTLNATPPLSLTCLASSLCAAGHLVRIIDAVGEGLDQVRPGYRPNILVHGLDVDAIVARVEPGCLFLGISCMFSHEWPLVRELIAALSSAHPGVPIVLGGEHASAAPEFALEDAPGLTCCAIGEGEETAVALAAALLDGTPLTRVEGLCVRTAGGPLHTPRRGRIRAVDDLPPPRWDLVPFEAYLSRGLSFGVARGRTLPLLASRGCPYRCTFCSNEHMWTTRYVARDPRRVVDEIEQAVQDWRIDAVDFYDLTAIVKRSWILEFCRLLMERNLHVTWQLPSGTRSEALDADVLQVMAAAGCRNVSYAPESGSPRVLERIRKQINLSHMEASMRAAVELGLNVKANVMIGFPGERRDELLETMAFLLRMARAGVHDVSVWTFAPYPGSELFEELRAAGAIAALSDDYFASLLSYSDLVGAVSYNAGMTSRELEQWRVAGMALFYAANWTVRPLRPLRTLAHIATGRYESRLEMSLGNVIRRLRGEAS